jgi:hypothetical protein
MVLGALGREHGGRIGERDDSCINLQFATADGEYGRGVMNFPISHFLGIVFKNIGQKRRNSSAKFNFKEKKNRRKTRWQPQIFWKITMVEVASTTFDSVLLPDLTLPFPVLVDALIDLHCDQPE